MIDHCPLYKHPTIEPSRGNYGRWVIRLSEVTFRFYWRRRDAERFLQDLQEQSRSEVTTAKVTP